MFPVTLKFIMTHDSAVLPKYNHDDPYTGDSGLDVTAVEDVTIPYRGKGIIEGTGIISEPWAVVPVGLKLAYITPGYWLRVEGRSGMGFKKHVFPHFGIIDNPYRGDMGIKLYNFSDTDVIIKAGDKIAQLIVYPLIQANVEFTEVVSESKRGEKGFGSSDAIDQDMFKQLECFSEVMVDNKPARLE
jgi:dUTP pyrophosphatase